MSLICTVDSPVGLLTIKVEDDCVTGVDLFSGRKKPLKTDTNNKTVKVVKQQLTDYFSNPHSRFTFTYQLQGTDFQKKVWQTMLKIAEGKVMTYGEVAKKLNSSPRAVGNACRANPIPIIVPCHRIVAQTGLGGFAGKTAGHRLDVKRWLLKHEGAVVNGL